MVFRESKLSTKVLGKIAMQAQSFYHQHASTLLPALQPHSCLMLPSGCSKPTPSSLSHLLRHFLSSFQLSVPEC